MAGPFPTKKITALAPFTPPLTGFEEFECVQGGNSRKVDSRAFVLPTDALITAVDQSGNLPGSRFLLAGQGVQLTDNGPGQPLVIEIVGTGAMPGDPTALVGLTAVNGIAATWMRSDSAPALDQSIAPTWTGAHLFQAAATFSLARTNATPTVLLSAATMSLRFNETDAAANNRQWEWQVNGEQLRLGLLDDTGALQSSPILIDRTAGVTDSIALAATAITATAASITLAGGATGVLVTGVNGLRINDTDVVLTLFDTDALADEKWYWLRNNAGVFSLQTRTDAGAVGANVIQVDRTGTVVDSFAVTATAITLNGVNVSDYARLSQVNAFTQVASAPASYPIILNSTSPFWAINETDAAANNRLWDFGASGEGLAFRVLSDAGVAVSWLVVDRTANTIDSIALTATTFTFTGVMAGPVIRQLRESFNSQTWAAGANTLDLNLGNQHRITLQGNVTLSFSNPPSNSLGVTFTIFLLQDGTGSRTVTWPASVHWSDGVAPTLTTTANRMDAVTLTTFDGGTTYFGGQVLANMVP